MLPEMPVATLFEPASFIENVTPSSRKVPPPTAWQTFYLHSAQACARV